MSRPVTRISDFSPKNFVTPLVLRQNQFVQKSGNKMTLTFFTLGFAYKNSNGVGDFLVQGDETFSRKGIRLPKFKSEDGRPGRNSILIEFDGPNGETFNAISDMLQQESARAIYDNASKLGAFGKKFVEEDDEDTPVNPSATILSIKKSITPALAISTTEDGKKDLTRPRYRFMQINDFGESKTTFYRMGSAGKLVPIPSKALIGRPIRFIPTIDFKRLYVGANASIQVFLSSAIITAIVDQPVAAPVEIEAAAAAAAADPDAVAAMERMFSGEVEPTAAVESDEPSWAAAGEFPVLDAAVKSSKLKTIETDDEEEIERRPTVKRSN
jgi:hypothetical protein